MAITLTERFRCSAAGRTMLFVDVGQDETISTFTAASVGLTCIEEVQNLKWSVITSGAGDTASFTAFCDCSILAEGGTVDFGKPLKAGSVKHILVIGW